MVNNHGSRKKQFLIVPNVGKITYERFTSNTVYLRSKMAEIVENYMIIGKELKIIKDNKVYKLGDYKSFVDYCKTEFGLSKTSAYNFINVYDRFSENNYKNYSYSLLVEMLSLPDEKLKEVSPSSTVKEVREIKKREEKEEKEEESPVILDGQISCDDIVEDEFEEVEIENIFKDSRNKLSSKAKFLFAFSLWIGINELLEEKKEPYGAVKELVDYYSKVYIMDAKVLRDKLKEYPLSFE